MNKPDHGTITGLLFLWGKGEHEALNKVINLVYSRLYDMAQKTLRGEYDCNKKDIRTCDLISEAYIALRRQESQHFESREDFFRLASHIMRTVLLVMARDRSRKKRGGDKELIQLSGDFYSNWSNDFADNVILIDKLISELGRRDKVCEEVVVLKYFGGFKIDEISNTLRCSPATVKRKWDFARAWLQKKMETPLEDC